MSCKINQWWLCDEPDWLRVAAKLSDAVICLIEMRIMSLDKQMRRLITDIKAFERTNQDTTELMNNYLQVQGERSRLQTKEGKLVFTDDVLRRAFEQYKEEVLPL